MAITYGLTDQGFVLKPLPVIRQELNAALQLAFGNSIDLGDRSVFGIIVGIFAERISQLWELLQTIVSSQDPDKATKTLLDAISALTGTFRPAAAPSKVTLTLTGTDTTAVQTDSRAKTASTGKEFATLTDVTLATVGAWAGLTAYVLGDRRSNNGSVYQNIQAGTSAASPGPLGTSTDLTTDGTCLWTFLGTGLAAVDVDAESVEVGPIVGVTKDITVIATHIGGWQAVTNVESASVGRLEATDSELRVLREAELSAAGSSPFDALRAALLETADVTSVTLFPNNTDTTDGDGVPPHAVEALVRGGADQAIFDKLLASVAAGIGTYGNQVGSSVDSQGTTQVEKFSRPVEKPIYLKMNVTTDSSIYPTDGNTQIAAAVITYGGLQNTGRDAVPAALVAQAFKIAGVIDVPQVLVYDDVIGTPSAWVNTTAYIATVGSRSVVTNGGRTYICITSGTSDVSGGPTGTGTDITDNTAHWRFLGNNVVITSRQLATYSLSNIAITSAGGTP